MFHHHVQSIGFIHHPAAFSLSFLLALTHLWYSNIYSWSQSLHLFHRNWFWVYLFSTLYYVPLSFFSVYLFYSLIIYGVVSSIIATTSDFVLISQLDHTVLSIGFSGLLIAYSRLQLSYFIRIYYFLVFFYLFVNILSIVVFSTRTWKHFLTICISTFSTLHLFSFDVPVQLNYFDTLSLALAYLPLCLFIQSFELKNKPPGMFLYCANQQ